MMEIASLSGNFPRRWSGSGGLHRASRLVVAAGWDIGGGWNFDHRVTIFVSLMYHVPLRTNNWVMIVQLICGDAFLIQRPLKQKSAVTSRKFPIYS